MKAFVIMRKRDSKFIGPDGVSCVGKIEEAAFFPTETDLYNFMADKQHDKKQFLFQEVEIDL